MQRLRLSVEDARTHATVLAEGKTLADEAGALTQRRQDLEAAMVEWVSLRDETHQKIEDLEKLLAAADGRARAAGWRVQESEEAGVKLARLRASAPNLFPAIDAEAAAAAEPETTGKKRMKG